MLVTDIRGLKPLHSKILQSGAAALVLLGTLAVAGGLVSPQLSTGASTGDSQPTLQQASLSGYGISESFQSLSASELDKRMSDIRAAGATWVRYDLSWSAVQQLGPDSYNWTISDRITAAATRHELKVVMILDLTPPYERIPGCSLGNRCAPISATDFATFAGKAAVHYLPAGVHTWEIWNEPNIAFRFGPATDPQHYVAMLEGSYRIIKSVDPSAEVIAGSTAPAASKNGDLRPLDFLRAMYRDGAQGSFDAISVHPYTYPLTPAQASADDAWGQMIAMHQVMSDNGDGDKLIWITEFGAPTNGPNQVHDHVSETLQATILTQAVSMYRQYSWSGPLFWYGYADSGTDVSSSENFYGLVRADGTKKPAYTAFTQATAKK
jgi:hypothetical protein